MKQCKSIKRALKRHHTIDISSGTYKSKAEHRARFERWIKATLKAQQNGEPKQI